MFNKPQQTRQRDPPGLPLQCCLKTVGDLTSWHWTTTSWQSLANLGNSCTFKTFWWYGGSFVVLHDFTLFDVLCHGVKEHERTTIYKAGIEPLARASQHDPLRWAKHWSLNDGLQVLLPSTAIQAILLCTLIEQISMKYHLSFSYFLTRSFSRWGAFPQIRTQSIRSKLSGKHQVLTSTQAIKIQFVLIPSYTINPLASCKAQQNQNIGHVIKRNWIFTIINDNLWRTCSFLRHKKTVLNHSCQLPTTTSNSSSAWLRVNPQPVTPDLSDATMLVPRELLVITVGWIPEWSL